jgi:hypothetical protein
MTIVSLREHARLRRRLPDQPGRQRHRRRARPVHRGAPNRLGYPNGLKSLEAFEPAFHVQI